MPENRNAGRIILICVITAIVTAMLVTWVKMALRLRRAADAGTFYQFVAADAGTENTVGEKVDITLTENTDTENEVYINIQNDVVACEEVYINLDTGYRVFMEDSARLLDAEEERELAQAMEDITAYGNAIFKTADSGVWNTASYAGEYYREKIGTDSGILLLIDMENRMLWMHCDGDVYQVITESYSDTVTDNVYPYATGGDYYECAAQAYGQALALLEGNRIAQPMKYISNALLAVILALLINYGAVRLFAGIRKPRRRELLGNEGNYFRYTEPRAFFIRESRIYRPKSRGSGGESGGGGKSRSSGGSRGGGRSGGGGGHRF